MLSRAYMHVHARLLGRDVPSLSDLSNLSPFETFRLPLNYSFKYYP